MPAHLFYRARTVADFESELISLCAIGFCYTIKQRSRQRIDRSILMPLDLTPPAHQNPHSLIACRPVLRCSSKAAKLATTKAERVAAHAMSVCADTAADVSVAPILGPDERHLCSGVVLGLACGCGCGVGFGVVVVSGDSKVVRVDLFPSESGSCVFRVLDRG